jgi:hypothetical protein
MRWSVGALLLLCSCKEESKDLGPEEAPQGDTGDTDDTDEPSVDADGDGHPQEVDCDDADPETYPGAPDLCGDDRITDCDRFSENGLVTVDGTQTFEDLQQALDAAGPGSEVRLCIGSYSGSFVAQQPVHLVSHRGADLTYVQGTISAPALSVPAGSTVTGLTLTVGWGPQGGGLHMTSEGTLEVRDCIVQENSADLGGGLSIPANSDVLLVGTLVADNVADTNGGGLSIGPGSRVELQDSVVERNRAKAGGGVFLDAGSTLIGGEILSNSSDHDAQGHDEPVGGGGVAGYGDTEVVGATLSGNVSNYGGGFSSSFGAMVLTDVLVTDNGPLTDGVWGGGGFVQQGSLEMLGTTAITANTSGTGKGGGLAVIESVVTGGIVSDNEGDQGGGIWGVYLELHDMVVSGNAAARDAGGIDAYTAVLYDVIVEGNTAGGEGGGVFSNSALHVVGGSISGNTASLGGGVMLRDSGSYYGPSSLEGVTISDNTAESGGGLWVAGAVELASCDISGNVAGEGGGVRLSSGQLSSELSDWGVEADDNSPEDLLTPQGAYSGYGEQETFSCAGSCAPLP